MRLGRGGVPPARPSCLSFSEDLFERTHLPLSLRRLACMDSFFFRLSSNVVEAITYTLSRFSSSPVSILLLRLHVTDSSVDLPTSRNALGGLLIPNR